MNVNVWEKTFCASPQCKNKCGKKMKYHEKKLLDAIHEYEIIPLKYEYFCGEPEDEEK